MLSLPSIATPLLLSQAVWARIISPRQISEPFDCGEIRVNSTDTTFSGFFAADLDTERRYVVTSTTDQKRLLTRFENNTLFTLVSQLPSSPARLVR